MSWEISKTDNSPQTVFNVLKKHNLLPESTAIAAGICNSVGSSGERFTATEDGELRCEIFVSSVIPHETASLDLIPVAEHFRHGYHDEFIAVMRPILDDLFIEFDVRRLGAAIPSSRSRTKRALCILGFKVEGRLRNSIKLHNEEPQDLRILGLLQTDYLASLQDDQASVSAGLPQQDGLSAGGE